MMIPFEYKNIGVEPSELESIAQSLPPEIDRMRDALKKGYLTDYASLTLCSDRGSFAHIKKVVEQKKALKPTALVVVGIGGSNLGTLAVQQAICGTFYNEQKPDIKIYFADTVDSDRIFDIALLVEQELEQGGNVIVNVISKSGSTTETVANFEIFVTLLQNYEKDAYNDYIVVTTDKDSKLWQLARKENFSCLEIPTFVGGRFSVFSAVGLFPLMLIGVDCAALLEGAHAALGPCLDYTIANNPAALTATALFVHYENGKNIHDTFLFSIDLEGLGRWYRQLLGESIGKEFDRIGGTVRVGITPTVSLGSTDLHSVGQLYLGGPNDKFTTFVTVAQNKSNLLVPMLESYAQLVEHIQGKTLHEIMAAIMQGTQRAYHKNGQPFVVWQLPEKNAWSIGYWLQCKMVEILYLGLLLDVNPFDQPNVESYKQETRKILAHG